MSRPVILTKTNIGSSLQNTTITQIAKSAECNRSCAIEIRNYHQNLEFREPSFYMAFGVNEIPPPPVIKPGYSEACLFRKVYGLMRGTAGLLIYNIVHVTLNDDRMEIISQRNEDQKLVLMWYVPFQGTTQHAIGIAKGAQANAETYKKMLTEDGVWFKREQSGVCSTYDSIVYNLNVKIEATISEVGNATWIINIQ